MKLSITAWKTRWDNAEERLTSIRKLLSEFHEQYDPKVVKVRPELQLQHKLYIKEAVAIGTERTLLMSQAYEPSGKYPPKQLKPDLFQ